MAGYKDILFSLPVASPYKLGGNSGGGDTGPTGPVQRYFRYNEGTTDYGQFFPGTYEMTGDFEIEFEYSTVVNSDSFGGIVGDDSGTSTRIFIPHLQSTSHGNVYFNSATWTGVALAVVPTELNHFRFAQVNNQMELFINGVSVGIQAQNDAVKFRNIFATTLTNFVTSGVLSNLILTDDGTVVRSFSIDDNKSVLDGELQAGQTIVMLNGVATDWGLFEDQGTHWQGIGLDTARWPAADYAIIKAS